MVCCLLLSAGIQAQEYSSSRRITSANGLSNDFVVCMAIDDKGYVWVGTEAGVNRIAGNTCLPLPTVPTVAGRRITSLYWDQRTGSILIGTELGMTRYNPSNGDTQQLDAKDGLVFSSINGIAKADDGLWLVYGNGKIQRLEGKDYTPKDLKLKQTYPNRCALDDGKGNLYIGHSRHGMTVVRVADLYTANYQQQTGDAHSLPGNNVRCIFKDRSARIWVGTDAGLALFHPATGHFTRVRNRDNNYEDNVYDIRQMNDGRLWVATDIGGVKIVNADAAATAAAGPDGTGELYYESARVRVSSLNPRSLAEDEFGNIWVGNHSTGVDFISNQKSYFSMLAYTDSEKNFLPVSAMAPDTQRGCWMASQNELVHWENGKVTERWADLGWMGRKYIFPRTLMTDSKGNVWMGVDDQGIYRLDRRTGTIAHIAITPEGSDIHTFSEDASGRIWIGAEFGVYVYENGKAVRHDTVSNKIAAPATAILHTAPDQLFMATLGNGICSYNLRTGKSRHLLMRDGLPSNKINQTIRSSDGGLWMATERGLVHLADAEGLTGLRIYGKDSGLSDDHVLALQQDASGNVWVSTYKGISCFVKRTNTFYNFNRQDTHQKGAFSPSAAITGPDGTCYFGSVAGVCCFNPQQMEGSRAV